MSNNNKGTVMFGAEQINGLFTPFIEINTSFGKTIRLTADCGMEKQDDAKQFCMFLFRIMSNPQDVMVNPEYDPEKN